MDHQGQYTNGSVFDGNDKLLFRSICTREAANRVSEQLDTTADDKPLRKLVYEYDSRGKLASGWPFPGNLWRRYGFNWKFFTLSR